MRGSTTDIHVNILVCTCQLEACSSSRPVFRHTTEQEPLPLATMISFCLSFSLSFLVWLRGKHFPMVLEQRRLFQLLHWQAFSNKEKDTCSIIASHCMIKQDVCIGKPFPTKKRILVDHSLPLHDQTGCLHWQAFSNKEKDTCRS